MEKALWVPLNADNWIRLSVWNSATADWLTGAVDGDFTVQMFRAGAWVSVPGLYVHEIGHGVYHVSNSTSATTPYRSTSEEQVLIRIKHDIYGGWRQFEFWARDLVGELLTAIQGILNTGTGSGSGSGSGAAEDMSFREMVADDLGTVFLDPEDFGVAVTYHQGATSKIIYAQVEFGGDPDTDGDFSMARATMEIRTADIPTPQRGDTVDITMPDGNEAEWKVGGVSAGSDFAWRLALYQDERPIW